MYLILHSNKEINMRYLLLILVFILSLQSQAGTIDPSTPDSKYLEYGEQFHCIYKICGSYNDGSRFCASAIVIDPHWILTAAHVVKNNKICLIHKNDKAHEVKQIIIHENFNIDVFGVGDIALGYVEDDIGLKFYPSLYDQNDELGKICSISGYGLSGNFLTGANKSDDKQRAGSNHIDRIEKDLLICSPSDRTSKKHTSLEFLISSGDSGGGLFIDGKLAGINSCVMASDKKPDSTYGDESGHTRVSKFVSWIRKTLNEKKK